jgi:hypothetical protein
LDVDDRLGLEQLLTQARVLALQLRDAALLRARRLRLAPALARREPFELARLALAPPRGQIRRVPPLAAQQRAQLARRVSDRPAE